MTTRRGTRTQSSTSASASSTGTAASAASAGTPAHARLGIVGGHRCPGILGKHGCLGTVGGADSAPVRTHLGKLKADDHPTGHPHTITHVCIGTVDGHGSLGSDGEMYIYIYIHDIDS